MRSIRELINNILYFFINFFLALAIPVNVHINKEDCTLLELRNDGHALLNLEVTQPIHSLQVHHEYKEEEIKIFYLIIDAENVLHVANTFQRNLKVI